MPSERVQRQIDRLLDEAEAAVSESNWTLARDRAQNVLAFDPENEDALAFLAAADRALGASPAPPTAVPGPETSVPLPTVPPESLPASFAGGRYQVKELLGEPFDPSRHEGTAIKAITWHQLSLVEGPAGVTITVYVDC